MAKFYDEISPELETFIKHQRIFFTGTAATDGRVNVSPKGMDSLRILGPNRVIWLNLTGSGNETAAHLLDVNRMTIMFCAFEGKPLILRLYGSAGTVHPSDPDWEELYQHFPESRSARQIYDVTIDSVQTSCGFAVPLMDYQEDRDILQKWVDNKSDQDIQDYWQEKNITSIDGRPTGIFGE
ncbi:MAG: pyridoxamine 5'-phosphate oxidase family protein [Roseivirga sp.]|nr:pyridoxamine 5'-phosphate oxidase family protein [Roseivirga sp.]